MTVASTDARTGPYDGNGSTTTFAYDFLVLDQAHLVVTVKTTSTGVEVVKTLTTHYSVTGVGTPSGGNIVFTSASTHAPSGTTITITRSVPKTQTTDLVNRGAVQPETLETGYDKLTQIDQDQQGEIDRGLKFAVSADLSSFNTSVPAPVASKAIAINSSNNGFELVNEPSASATAASASETAAAASAATAAAAASAVALPFTFDNSTSMADPGTGEFRLNHGTSSSVSAIAFSNSTADSGNPDVSDYIITMDDSSSTLNGHLTIVQEGTPATFDIYTVGAVTDNTAWLQVALTHVDSNGTFTNGTKCRLQFVRTGDKGDTGSTGATGSGEGIELAFESTTTDTDQGAGKVWLNHGTASSATVVYIDDVDSNAANINSFVDSFDDSGSSVKGRISIKKQLAPENYHVYNVTGSVTSASTYSKVACTHVVSAGTISDGDAVHLSFSRTGDKGDTGSTGADGDVSEATAVALAIALG